MPTYTVTNQRGDVVASIGVATTTGDQYPIELIGQGISLYGPIVAATQYRLMENFADDDFLTNDPNISTVPEGLVQYRFDEKIPYIFDGTNWIRMATGFSSASVLYNMEVAATGIDFGIPGDRNIFEPSIVGLNYHPTGLMLIPTTVTGTATGNAVFSLGTNSPDYENVMESNLVDANTYADTTSHIYLPLNGKVKSASVGSGIKLNISQEAGGGAGNLIFNALLFGFIAG